MCRSADSHPIRAAATLPLVAASLSTRGNDNSNETTVTAVPSALTHTGAADPTTPDDTVPMVITAPMATPVALQAGPEPGCSVMHDVVRLTDGHDVLLLEWNSPGPADPQDGVHPYRRVVAVDLASSTVSTVIPDQISFESSAVRLHLASTEIAVGEQGGANQTGMVVAPLTGSSFTPQALTFESLGLDDPYEDGDGCGPTGYTIDTSGGHRA